MRKALLVLLPFLAIFIAGCDRGTLMSPDNVQSKLKVLIERQITGNRNGNLTVYAMDFSKEGRILTFVCPCHLANGSGEFLNLGVEGNSFKLALLPDADYNVEVTYWAPNFDNKKVQFQRSR